MTLPKPINQYDAHYLVLLEVTDDKPRALLFDRDYRYLSEVFDEDGLLVDSMLRAGRSCRPLDVMALQASAGSPESLQCFALDEALCEGEV